MLRRSPHHRWTLVSRVMVGVLSLLALGGIVVAFAAFAYGRSAARQAFDPLLVGAAQDIAESISIGDEGPVIDLPVSAFGLLSLAPEDRIFYAIHGPDGALLTGYDGIPAALDTVQPRFRDWTLQDDAARFVTVSRLFSERAYAGRIYVTVGQTTRARRAMALDLTRRALFVTTFGGIALIVSALIIIRSAMRPLEVLTRDLAQRDPYDLTPMQADGPQEVRVLVGALNRFMGRLDRQVGAMKNLISDTAHQLRTPVAAIRAQAELALEDDAPRRLPRLERLVWRTRSLGRLLDQMLSRALVIHRIDNAAPTAIDLRDIALTVLDSRDHELLAPGKDVQLRIGEDAVVVLADEISLTEAVRNMLVNALRHGATPVVIGVSPTPTGSAIWVQDSGDGPPDAVRATLGQRFERSAASKGNSAGLGLSIVRAVAQAFGGEMTMATVQGGFRVSLTLPHHGAGQSQ
ncbi:sensor histidine kinase [Loktanella sp. DJP18]|uniref:sensor histidine kinase n=1 Tax=Loktanella sp. DJP18 TaxID=3409788 RepID=UPI003BB78A28